MTDLTGAVTPIQVDLIEAALARAEEEDAKVLLIRLDTPGGLVESTRDIIRLVRNAPVDIAVWVGPAGARAASAGVFLVAASDHAAMHPETNMGAASPVAAGGKDIPETMAKKVENDLLAMLRSLLEGTGRNSEWYEDAVLESVSISALDAVQERVVEFAAETPRDFLEQLGKRGIMVSGERFRFGLDETIIILHQPGPRHRFLSWLLNPQIAYFLLLGGMAGLFFELTSPGGIFPGVFGALCLVLGLYAMSVLPTNVTGLLLLALGLVLFVLEISITSYGLLSLAGLAALFFGSMILFKDAPGIQPLPMSTIVVTTLGLAALLAACGYAVGKAQVSRPETGMEAMAEARAIVRDWNVDHGMVFVRGALWRAKARQPQDFANGDEVVVAEADGLTLYVEPLPKDTDADGVSKAPNATLS